MLWRLTLFVGVLLAVLLVGASIAVGGIANHRHYCTHYRYRTLSNGYVLGKYCAGHAVATTKPHSTAGRYLRLSAAGVVVLTLAALPLMAGLSKRNA